MSRVRSERALGDQTLRRIAGIPERIDEAHAAGRADAARAAMPRAAPVYVFGSDAARCDCRILRHHGRPAAEAAAR